MPASGPHVCGTPGPSQCWVGRGSGKIGRGEGHSPPHICCTRGSGRSGVGGGSNTSGTTAGGRLCGSPTLRVPSWDPVLWSLAQEEDWAAPRDSFISVLLVACGQGGNLTVSLGSEKGGEEVGRGILGPR